MMLQADQHAQGRPSIVVLPFDSMIPTGLERVLCEALPHELIQALSRLRWIRVIARGTAFRFRAPVPDLAAIGRQLSVRYALCGMIERLGEIIAITIELSDCAAGEVIWADRFEVRPEDLQEVRHEIVTRVVSSLEIYIPQNEADHIQSVATRDLDAWSNYHLGLRHMFRFSQEDNETATSLFRRAIIQDPSFARAHAGLSFTRFQDAFLKYKPDAPTAIADARRHAERSMELDPLDPFCNLTMGRSFWLEGDPLGGLSWLERSVALSPNFAQGHYSMAFANAIRGEASTAIDTATRAQDLSPLDPLLYAIYSVRAVGLLRNSEISQAVVEAEHAARAPGAHHLVLMIAAAACALAGKEKQARYWSDEVRARRPDASREQFFTAFPFTEQSFRRKLEDGLTRVGF
ncbi:transcriptional regulator [Hoeflea sp. WL0058]|uniref:Transcriptional regulator n=1 Tax=Flavimaribacter sediminis TaxID=2865987 RepID=A0AAE2ZTS3_9HYPH|nr:transcriptional regulator [Flavimaribacter sediminis]MBW8640756.1 transcriptional regulator [Flavimaribacter sediminis]